MGGAQGERPRHVLQAAGQQCVDGLDQLGRRRPQQPLGRASPSNPELVDEAVGDLLRHLRRTDHARCGTLRDRLGEKAFRRWHGQQGGDRVRPGALAEDGDVVRITAERGDVVAHPLQRQHEVAQIEIVLDGDVRGGQRREVHAAQRAEAVVHRHVHAAPAGQGRAVVKGRGRAAQDVAAAVDEEHHRQRVMFGHRSGPLRGDDVESQAVLAHRLVAAQAGQGVAALLRGAVGEAVAGPHPRPRLRRLRRPEAQQAHRWTGVGNGSPAVDPVAAESLDDAPAGGDVHGVLVHSDDGSERTAPAAPDMAYRSAGLA